MPRNNKNGTQRKRFNSSPEIALIVQDAVNDFGLASDTTTPSHHFLADAADIVADHEAPLAIDGRRIITS